MSAVAVHEPPALEAVAPPIGEEQYIAPGYQVVEHLNRSLVLDVYDVWSEERDCRCIAKTLRPDRLDDRKARTRLEREGRLLKRFTHPHIVRAYELLLEPQPIVVLETLTGHTLGHIVATRRRRLDLGDVAFLGIHLCSAMHYLHGKGILHLDLKPSNVAADGGRVKVLDLSLARRAGRGSRGVGTRQYLSPEQARGDRFTAATDVWGIGAVMFEAATGRRPFAAWTGRRYEQLERRADPVRAHRRLPSELGAAIDRCLDPEPERRPAVDELAELLDELA